MLAKKNIKTLIATGDQDDFFISDIGWCAGSHECDVGQVNITRNRADPKTENTITKYIDTAKALDFLPFEFLRGTFILPSMGRNVHTQSHRVNSEGIRPFLTKFCIF